MTYNQILRDIRKDKYAPSSPRYGRYMLEHTKNKGSVLHPDYKDQYRVQESGAIVRLG